jgi:hypothetical protein
MNITGRHTATELPILTVYDNLVVRVSSPTGANEARLSPRNALEVGAALIESANRIIFNNQAKK